MDTAQHLRKENIAEYILYLWQMEDLLRALQMSPEAIYAKLVQPRELDPEEGQQLLLWYMEYVNLMREEGKESQGHLQHTLHLIGDLNNLHAQLLKLPIGERYRTLYEALSAELPALRAKLKEGDEVSDVELCFRALYGVMLMRIKGAGEQNKAIEDVLGLISPVVAELASVYRRVERGEVDLYKNT